MGIDVQPTDRGGDVTYHGPGQLVAYPIFDLRPDRCDVRKYVRDLAAVMVSLCRDFELGAGLVPDDPKYVGVWVDRDSKRAWTEMSSAAELSPFRRIAKIGAIGVKLSRWCTMHGLAFNVSTDLGMFDRIVPCGIKELGVTSLADLGVKATVRDVATLAARHFGERFDATVEWSDSPR